MKKNLLIFIGLLICSKFVLAQKVVLVTEETYGDQSPVRSLRNDEYQAFLNGVDINNRAEIAELNHYPLPDKLIPLKKELDLSLSQMLALNDISKVLKMKKKEIGESVIRNENVLDSIFRTHKADDGNIVFYGNRFGLYEGEYRTAVLMACYRAQKLLSDRQLKKYKELQKH